MQEAIPGKGDLSIHIDDAPVQRRTHAHEFAFVLEQRPAIDHPGQRGRNELFVTVDQRTAAGAVLRHTIQAICHLVVDRAGGVDRGPCEAKRPGTEFRRRGAGQLRFFRDDIVSLRVAPLASLIK